MLIEKKYVREGHVLHAPDGNIYEDNGEYTADPGLRFVKGLILNTILYTGRVIGPDGTDHWKLNQAHLDTDFAIITNIYSGVQSTLPFTYNDIDNSKDSNNSIIKTNTGYVSAYTSKLLSDWYVKTHKDKISPLVNGTLDNITVEKYGNTYSSLIETPLDFSNILLDANEWNGKLKKYRNI